MAPRIFIGSSGKSRERIANPLASRLARKGLRPLPWWDAFKPGDLTLDTIVHRLPDEVDAAIFIFACDDVLDVTAGSQYVTRDNVVLECGVFFSALDLNRVLVIMENGVKVLSDMLGLTVEYIDIPKDGADSHTDSGFKAHLDELVTRIHHDWADLLPRDQFDDGGMGLAQTLKETRKRANAFFESAASWASGSGRTDPIELTTPALCVETYCEALGIVKNRFWTTSFLTSGFWSEDKANVAMANRSLLDRARADAKIDLRRLFLTPRPLRQEIAAWFDEQVFLRQHNRDADIDRSDRDFNNLDSTMREQIAKGFQVRVAHVPDDVSEKLGNVIGRFDPGDSEVAIYDNFRFDVFRGGRVGEILGVRIYGTPMLNFGFGFNAAERYFNAAWEIGEPAEDFLVRIEDARHRGRTRIDYEANWLARYEFNLEPKDSELKVVELKRVEEHLRHVGRWGKIRRYLDIGTCTCRYPIAFAKEGAVVADGSIIGIDSDGNCVEFADSSRRLHAPNDDRIRVRLLDFLDRDFEDFEPFDLITCMLGTVSHFGWNRQSFPANAAGPHLDDDLQFALRRMEALLSADGTVVIGNWSDQAREKKALLSIYTDADRNRLARWTPRTKELLKRLAAINLRGQVLEPDVRLDIIVCNRTARTPS